MLVDELVGGVGEIALHFLLDGAALLVPFRLRIIHAAHAGGLRLQRHVHVGRRNGGEVLRDVLLRVRVVFAAQQRIDGRRLVGGHAGAAAEHHVLLRVRHARKAVWRLVAAHDEIGFNGGNRGERVADDDHLGAVVERGARNVGGGNHRLALRSCTRARQNRGTQEQQRQDLQSFHCQDLSFRSDSRRSNGVVRISLQAQRFSATTRLQAHATPAEGSGHGAQPSKVNCRKIPLDSRRDLSIGRISNAFSCLFV